MLPYLRYFKCDDWVVLIRYCDQSESGMVKAAYTRIRAFPQEQQLELTVECAG